MKARVVSIESGSVFTDGQRRICIRIEGADVYFSRVQVTESAIGIAGLKLDDELEVGFAPIRDDGELKITREFKGRK